MKKKNQPNEQDLNSTSELIIIKRMKNTEEISDEELFRNIRILEELSNKSFRKGLDMMFPKKKNKKREMR